MGVTSFSATGTVGQVLTSAGAGAPTWGSTVANANDLTGGTAGQIVYQSGVGVTSFSATGTVGQVLTSQGLSGPTWSTTVLSATGLAGGATGAIAYQSVPGTTSFLTIGTVNQVLTSSGTGPRWSTTVLSATGLAGGPTGSIPYQSVPGTTSFLTTGTANQILTSNGAGPLWSTTVLSATGLAGGVAGSLPYQTAAATTTMLSIGITGTILRSTGTAPAWSNPGGFIASFGGNAVAGNFLVYGLPYTLFSTTPLSSSFNNLANLFVMPIQGILVGASCYNFTGAPNATMTVHVNNGATASVTAAAGQFTPTAARALTISPTTTLISAGSTVEVRINVSTTGNTMIILYFA